MAPQLDPRVAEFKEKALPRLVKQFRPHQVLLFGSRATGSALEDSDLDIIIVSERFRNVPWHQHVFEVLWAVQSPIPIEVLCYTPEEAQARRGQIDWVAQALKEGIILYEASNSGPIPRYGR